MWVNICAFSHILGSPSSYMNLQLLPSEFTLICEKFIFFFISVSALLPVFLKISTSTSVCLSVFLFLYAYLSSCFSELRFVLLSSPWVQCTFMFTILNLSLPFFTLYNSIFSSLFFFSFVLYLFHLVQVSSRFFTFLRLSSSFFAFLFLSFSFFAFLCLS